VSAFELMWQKHEQAAGGNGVLLTIGAILDDHRVPDILDAHLVNGEFTRIRCALDIGDGGDCVAGWLSVHYLILLQTRVYGSELSSVRKKAGNLPDQ
jgi:hypothetical protein